MTATMYLITYHAFNHDPQQHPGRLPLDPRFTQSERNYVYYLIDETCPEALRGKNVIIEQQIDPEIHTAGGKHFGEWSFLLAELKHRFCTYPCFMISSRFYEKNRWLHGDLNTEWDRVFAYLKQYGWGYLPSYDRPFRWINLDWRPAIAKEVWKYKFFPFVEKTYHSIQEHFGVRIPEDYQYTADFFCNYIGFQSREHLEAYVNFYMPLINALFDAQYTPTCDLKSYIRSTNTFRNEKPFTFYLELICHLFFFKQQQKYFGLHYDGYYEVDEAHHQSRRLQALPVPLLRKIKRTVDWQWMQLTTEGALAPTRRFVLQHTPPVVTRCYRKSRSKVGRFVRQLLKACAL